MISAVETQDHRDWAVNQADAVEGYMELDELAWLYENAYGNCIEMGSYRGRSATVIGLKLKVVGGHLSCIDCFNDDECSTFQKNLGKSGVSASVLRMRSIDALDYFEDESLDFIFIDTSHEYDDTIDEIVGWLPKLKLDGILCGHDYGYPEFPGLTEAVNELCPGFQNPVRSIWCIKANQFSTLQRQLFSVIHQSRQKLAKHLKHHNQEIIRLKGAVNHYDKSLIGTQLQYQELERELISVQAHSQEIEHKLTSAQSDYQELKHELVSAQTYSHELERELTSAQTCPLEHESKLAILESQTQELQEQARTDNKKLENLQTRTENLRRRRDYLSQELANSKASYQELRKVNEDLEDTIVAMQSSKFWRLRSGWLRVKNFLGLSTD